MAHQYTPNQDHLKTLLVGVYAPSNPIDDQQYYYDEFLSLIHTLELPYDETYFMKVRSVDNNLFLTTGKLEELKKVCTDRAIELVAFSEPLSTLQERNLERALGCAIFDREKLILEIFKKSAHSAEGKIQVEMAEIGYLKTRMIGRGRELSQQAGIIGTRGPGETAKEEMRRQFADKLRQAQKRLETLERSREIQRQRRINSNIPLMCIIGYTNAGKSSLLNRIAKGGVLAENKLFATLDTTTRELFVDGTRKALISDTVGFISQLPHNLIAAFKSTLDELHYAKVLLHVVDISNPAWKNQIEVVRRTLEELDVDQPMIYVFNKIDLLSDSERDQLPGDIIAYQPNVFIHTKSKEGVEPLIHLLRDYHL
ncbi:MAG: GTPase HflX [Candidatus Babeliales bacterium]|jgi:GTP-binding protein HflX